MNEEFTVTERWHLRNGMTHGTGRLSRFKFRVSDGEEAYAVNVHSSTPRQTVWKIEGEKNWLRFKQRFAESKILLHFTDGSDLAIDLGSFAGTHTGQRKGLRGHWQRGRGGNE